MRAVHVVVVLCGLSLRLDAHEPAMPETDRMSASGLVPSVLPLPERTAEMRTAWIRHFGNRMVPSDARVQCATAQQDGGVIVSGQFGGQPLTVRFGPDGGVVWADVYLDPDERTVVPAAVYADSLGNAYVVLRAYAKSDGAPWTVVVKYGPSGERKWVTPHPGMHKASALDKAGNVFLGLIWSESTVPNRFGTADYVIVGVSPLGDIRWRRTYDGPWGGADNISALQLDGHGNIYVTGLALRHPWTSGIATMMFDKTGSMQWMQLHSPSDEVSPASPLMGVDPSGGTFVTAYENGKQEFDLVRYNVTGAVQWVTRYTGIPKALLSDPSGDLYLVTTSDISRIDGSGVVRWTQPREGATAFTIAGGLFFAGSSAAGRVTTAAFNIAGTKKWSTQSTPAPETGDELITMISDGTGKITAVGTRLRTGGGADFVGHICDTLGTPVRTLHYAAPASSYNISVASCVDRDGNTYVVGTQSYPPGDRPHVIVKFSPSGDTLFTRQVPAMAANNVRPVGMTVDGLGKIRVAGFDQAGTPVLLCFSDLGVLEWAASSSQPLYSYDVQMKSDAGGKTILVGRYFFKEVVIVAFSSTGNQLWTRSHSGAEYSNYFGADMDSAGNVYLGITHGTDDAAVGQLLKYSPDGQPLWAHTSAGSLVPLQGPGAQKFQGLAVDPAGRCVVALQNWKASDSTKNILTLCYSPAGELRWWGSDLTDLTTFYRTAVLFGKNGDVLLSGRGTIRDYGLFNFLLRYDAQGNKLSRADIPGDYTPEATVMDAQDRVCAVGSVYSTYSGMTPDIFTYSYGPSGSLAWVEKFNASPGAHDYAVGIGMGRDNTVIVSGYSTIPVQDGPPRETGTFFTLIGYVPLAAPGSLVANPGFESELTSWVCNTNGAAMLAVIPAGEKSPLAASLVIQRQDSNITLYQSGIPLEPFAHYRLTYSARCNTGHDVSVSLIRHTPPYNSYGLAERVCDLGREWTSFSIDFFTEGFTGLVNDGRIMFRFAGLAESGDEYLFDNIALERITSPDAASTVRHPSDVSGGAGKPVLFRVVAPQATRFQWQKNGEDIPGADWNRYATPALTAADSGTEFSCRVTGPAGVLQTRSAVVHVHNEPVSLVRNHRFDEGTQGWEMAANAPASLAVEGPSSIAHVSIQKSHPNLQLLAGGIELIGGARYLLSFRARSSTGHDVAVSLVKHTPPYTPYAPDLTLIDLSTDWRDHTMSFVATDGMGVVADARLMFWMTPYASDGDEYYFDDVMLEEVIAGPTTETAGESTQSPLIFALEQNTPNPFNPETSISFTIEARQHVRLVVYDLLGREVARIVDAHLDPGSHTARYRAAGMASGVYFYRLETARQVATKKMMMVR